MAPALTALHICGSIPVPCRMACLHQVAAPGHSLLILVVNANQVFHPLTFKTTHFSIQHNERTNSFILTSIYFLNT